MTLFGQESISRECRNMLMYVQNSQPECIIVSSDISPVRSPNRNDVNIPHLASVINVFPILLFLTYSDISNFEDHPVMQSMHLKDLSIQSLCDRIILSLTHSQDLIIWKIIVKEL
jgi:hypothetical protein